MSGRLLTADQVAAQLGVPKSWVYEQSRRGRIPTVTLGRYKRYRAEAIEEWIERLEAGEGGAQLMARRVRSARMSGRV
jgi:excisionase family DNA binding protein